jgi:hypothetical protein
MSTALARLQRDFMRRLEEPGPCDAGIAAYRRGVAQSGHAALAAAYPVVRRLVGEAFFREAAARYRREHPSRSGDLHEFGAAMARFLEGYPHAASLAYLPGVARLEWAVHESASAADAPALQFEWLAALGEEDLAALRCELAPSVRLVRSEHAIHALWEANQPDRDGTPRADGAQRVLVWRHEGSVRAQAVDAPEWNFLEALARGATLEACQESLGPAAAARFGPLLAGYALGGVIAGFRSGPR